MEKHISIVAALHIGLSILGIIIGIIGFAVLKIVGDFSGDFDANFVLSIVANVVIIFFAVLSIPGIIAGIGLLKRKEWARIFTLILSVLDLFNFPVGTAVGVYSIWVLSDQGSVAEFKNQNKRE